VKKSHSAKKKKLAKIEADMIAGADLALNVFQDECIISSMQIH